MKDVILFMAKVDGFMLFLFLTAVGIANGISLFLHITGLAKIKPW